MRKSDEPRVQRPTKRRRSTLMSNPSNPVATILEALRLVALSHEHGSRDLRQPDLVRAASRRDARAARDVAARIEDGRICIQQNDTPMAMQIPGCEVVNTGGNCTALSLPTKRGGHILLTASDDGGYPPMVGDTTMDVGIYNKGKRDHAIFFEAVPLAVVLANIDDWKEKF